MTQPSLGVGYELGVAGLGVGGLGFGMWVLGFGIWVLGFGFWVLGSAACSRLIALPFIRKAEETSVVSVPQQRRQCMQRDDNRKPVFIDEVGRGGGGA